MAEFVIPEFLQNHSTDEVHAMMKSILPADLDISEGGHAWNLTRPTALVVAELCEFILPEVIKLIFPEWSYGEFLDGHARARGITRREASAASGEVTITGEPGTTIPAGTLFSTPAVNDEPSIDYSTLESVQIPSTGSVNVNVQCTQAGTIGNTPANTVVLVSSTITGVNSVTNPESFAGGAEEEEDESLIERITEFDMSQEDSFVGSTADYKRWATSVNGVGDATVVSAQDDSGMVQIYLTDINGVPATEQLCEAVYNYIMRPDSPGERLAPVNALLSVLPPSTMGIGISAVIELKENATIEAVKAAFLAQLAAYLPVAMEDQEIKLTKISALISATEGVNDYKDVKIGIKSGSSVNYGTSNIPITTTQLPEITLADIVFTSGTV